MALRLPFGAPLPSAPPCIRHRRFPLTAGDWHGFPRRVFAPQRMLDCIGEIFRLWLLVILFCFAPDHTLRVLIGKERHRSRARVGQKGLGIGALSRRGLSR